MNNTILLPNTRLSLMDWMIKHNVSTNICSLDLAISRAYDSLID